MKKIMLLVALIGAGYYGYSEYFSPTSRGKEKTLRIKKLFDKVASTPVSAQEAKPVFKLSVLDICEINGVDTVNGFGTTEECINNFEISASDYCFGQFVDFDSKVYDSQFVLKNDLFAYRKCSIEIVREKASK